MTDGAAAAAIEQQSIPRRGKSAAAFRTISEVAAELGVPTHVLRFWETKFSQIRPMKRGGGRRYYRPEDITLLKKIRALLYDDGYTIKGVQKLLRDGAQKNSRGDSALVPNSNIPASETATPDPAGAVPSISAAKRTELKAVLDELIALRKELNEL